MAAKKVKWSVVLDDSEGEAAPLQRVRDVDDVGAYLVDRHVALIDGHEFDVGGIVDGVPDELAVIGLFEPAAEGVVPAEVRVDARDPWPRCRTGRPPHSWR